MLAAAGGFAGGWLSLRWMHRGVPAAGARFRVCLPASVARAGRPPPSRRRPSAAWACVGISISFFAVAAFSVNMYTLPLDTFGGAQRGIRASPC